MILAGLLRAWGTLGKVTPAAMTFVFALLSVTPLRMPDGLTVTPSLSLMAVYYWTIYRPDLMPPALIFLIGIVQDVVSGAYLGLTPLLLLGTYAFALSQRRAFLGKPFALAWGGFFLVLLATTSFTWIIVSLIARTPVPLLQPALQFLSTLLLFPLVVWLFVRTHRRLLPGQ
ncbi:rod shape-determining protein MreD [Elstera sp.]|jgi:rod shape-determining protein MreD|uniref:rod shape-determining protein MreD n=1 Tax=Elstera sp. TaxID=1916664 RepID=UPI0037C085B5